MCMYFNTKTDVAQNLIDHFFSNFHLFQEFMQKDDLNVHVFQYKN